ncbi:BTAD domain-containing putative transcriptional regulator [Polymorphospora lycopeni]|uniref:BTAD domain-containing putative transcriptional regulator n=1 Tax=Polymorphospora lycopeni TaxID=3140240 RepID=A0ABV5CW21_9ACTN
MEDRLRFGLLGPVQAWAGDRPVVLGPPMQRAVLAALLLHANRVTSVDELVDLLWEAGPPRTARKNVQLYVWRLRKLLGDRLVSSPPGYRIAVDPADLDLTRFEDLLRAARTSVRAGRCERAGALYRSALDLWRGEPLADVAGIGTFGAGAARLDRLRLAAYEEYVDVELDLDRHQAVLPLLDDLVTRYPLHERFAEQQVTTLHHLGRRGAAVDAYLRCRRTLADELGLRPGPVLQRLGELARGPADPPAPGPRGSALRELPHTVAAFVGRQRELGVLRERLTDRRGPAIPLCVVTGPAGVGKSALAIRAAHQVADAFPDGQLYADLRGATAGLQPAAPIDVLGRFLRVLGVADNAVPAEVAEASARLRSLLADRRLLLVLDNAHDAAQVRPLIPAGTRCAVLVTSRRNLVDVDGAGHLELDVLTDADAVELLVRLAGGPRVAAEADTAALLVRRLGGLPLAIRIAGARLAARPNWTLATLADRLHDERRRLHELRLGDIAVRTSFLVSYQHLADPMATRLFRLLGAVDGPDVTAPVAAVLLDVDPPQALDALDELVDARLLDETATGRYAMHDLIRLFARERAGDEPPADRDAAVDRMLAHHLDLTRHALGLLRPGTRTPPITGPPRFVDADTALAWLTTERTNLVAATVQAAGSTAHARHGADLADSLFLFFEMSGHVADWLTVDRAGIDAAVRLGDRVTEARLRHDLAVAYFYLHRPDEAARHLEHSLLVSRAAGDDEGRARALNQFGVLHGMAGDYERAAEFFKDSLRLRRKLGDERSCAAAQGNIGMAYRLAGRLEESVRHCRAAASLARRAAAPEVEVNALGNLGEVQCMLGRYSSALRYLRRSLAIAGVPANERNRGSIMGTLADAYLGAGRPGPAIRYAELAVEAMRRADFRHGEALALRRAGRMLCAHGDPGRGIEQLRLALALFTDLKLPEAAEVRAELRAARPIRP